MNIKLTAATGLAGLLAAVIAVTAVVRLDTAPSTTDPLIVSGGVPPEAPPAGARPPVGPSPGPNPAQATEGEAARYSAWAAELADRVEIPSRVLAAYALAEKVVAARQPSCGLSWVTLAGIGVVESAHGSYAGAMVSADGTSTPSIVGPPLDGRPGVMAIADTDGGRYDGDTRWDRAVGPMQFLPSTWRQWGVDADGDGLTRPDDLDDAAATAGIYLCGSTTSMRTGAGWWAAVTTYNRSGRYARQVLERSNGYAVASLR